MHRIEQSIESLQPPPADSEFSIDSALFSPPSHDTTCALFGPLDYEPRYAYPLIVWLHGQGSDENQLVRIMPEVSMRNYVAAAPRGACITDPDGSDYQGYGWQQSEDAIQKAEQAVFDGMASARRKYHVAPRRVFLAGFDCGGTMAFRVAMNHPERFAGVLSLCGVFPSGRTPLGHLTQARQMPVFLAVGRDSREYPPTAVCENLRLLHTAGLSITLRQYPCGHELSPQMLGDMDRWIIEQVTSLQATPVE